MSSRINFGFIAVIAIAVLLGAVNVAKADVGPDKIEIASEDGNHVFRIGGRVMFDIDFNFATGKFGGTNRALTYQNSFDIRRARIHLRYKMFNTVAWKLQIDISDNGVVLTDAYMALILDFGELVFGQQYALYGHTSPQSSNYDTFVEAGFVNAFAPGRALGVQWINSSAMEGLLIAFGLFKQVQDTAASQNLGNGAWFATLRGALAFMNDENMTMHAGLSILFGIPDQDTTTFGSRGLTAEQSALVSSATVASDLVFGIGADYILVMGGLSVMLEYVVTLVDPTANAQPGNAGGNLSYHAVTLEVAFILTGERREYKNGELHGVKPAQGFMQDGGIGALEVALRLDYIDMTDKLEVAAGGAFVQFGATGTVQGTGSTAIGVVVGLNWYFFSNARLMFNVGWYGIEDGGDVYNIALRLHFFI